MSQEVKPNTELDRFEIYVDGELAGFTVYRDYPAGENRLFDHTVIKEAFQGQGLSKPLIKLAMDETRKDGRKVIPACSAVEGFIKKNPEYQDLLANV